MTEYWNNTAGISYPQKELEIYEVLTHRKFRFRGFEINIVGEDEFRGSEKISGIWNLVAHRVGDGNYPSETTLNTGFCSSRTEMFSRAREIKKSLIKFVQ